MSPPLEYISQTNNHLSPTLEATNTNAASLEIFGVYNLTLGQGEEDLGSPVHIPGVLIEWC